jgi:hypothetical protein
VLDASTSNTVSFFLDIHVFFQLSLICIWNKVSLLDLENDFKEEVFL